MRLQGERRKINDINTTQASINEDGSEGMNSEQPLKRVRKKRQFFDDLHERYDEWNSMYKKEKPPKEKVKKEVVKNIVNPDGEIKERKFKVLHDAIFEAEMLTDTSLAVYHSAISPFVSEKVSNRLISAKNQSFSDINSSVDIFESIKPLEQPSLIQAVTMRDYQKKGLSWLVDRYDRGINCILADEMGLGKTLQTISFFAYLMENRGLNGPHLVVRIVII